MKYINEAVIAGNLGADPENHVFESGQRVANFRVATTSTWTGKQSGEKRERTEWHGVTAYGYLADLAMTRRSGDGVFIKGEIRTESYVDKESGSTVYVKKIHANTILPIEKVNARRDDAQAPAGSSSLADHADFLNAYDGVHATA